MSRLARVLCERVFLHFRKLPKDRAPAELGGFRGRQARGACDWHNLPANLLRLAEIIKGQPRPSPAPSVTECDTRGGRGVKFS